MKRIFLFSLIFCACSIDKTKLVGSWQAVAYYEAGQSVVTPLNAVQLTFSPTGDYTFNSIGFYEEKGQYRVAGEYLFLLDTTATLPVERALKIQYLSEDSLKIGMAVGEKQGAVFLGRIN